MQGDPVERNDSASRIGSGMTIVAWILVLGLATYYFDHFLDQQRNPNQDVSYSEGNGAREVMLQRNRQGHYLSSGKINGMDVAFLLDTGATNVSVPKSVADKLRLQRGPEIDVITANGTIPVNMTVLAQVQLGNIVMHDVRASINPYMEGEEILLGMTFLKHLEFTQRGEQLILRQYN